MTPGDRLWLTIAGLGLLLGVCLAVYMLLA